MKQKRLLTIQDYSCLGRCSLTVAQPTISSCGIECVAIPTAILSNHTQFESWTFVDLTNHITEAVKKWEKYNCDFDCIYTGYLSTSQISIVKDLIQRLRKENTLVYVDPAMADNGQLYKGFTNEHVEKMKELISVADYIKPNITEAAFLLGEDPSNINTRMPSFYIKMAKRLASFGARNIILTGIKRNGKVSIIVYKSETDETIKISFKHLDTSFHGTGDLFSSALVSLLTLGKPLKEAITTAHNYVVKSMKYSLDDNLNGLLYGPEFEKAIPYLVKKL